MTMLSFINDQFQKDPKDRESWVHPGRGNVVLVAHNCHVKQANDGLSGVAVCRELSEYPSIVCAEGHGQEHIGNYEFAIYLDGLGTNNTLKCNQTFSGNTKLDKSAKHVFKELYPFAHQGFRNDEMRIEQKGVPCLAIHRFPFEEYHTQKDTPNLIDDKNLEEAKIATTKILSIMEQNYTVLQGMNWPDAFTRLDKYGLWTDWHINRPMKDLKELILMNINEANTVLDIADNIKEGFFFVKSFIDNLIKAGICDKLE